MFRLMNKQRFFGIAMIFCLLASACAPQKPAEQQPTPTFIPTSVVPLKPTYTVARGEVVDQFQFTGRITPVNEYPLYFQSSGRVRKVYFNQGDEVKQGDIIADLDGIDALERQLAFNQLNLRRAEIYLEMAEIGLRMFKKSTPKWTLNYTETLTMKEREVELAQLGLKETQLRNEEVQDIVDQSLLISPADGVLISLSIREGREVQGFQDVAVVADLSLLEVSASLTSSDMSRLEEGMPVTVELFGTPGEVTTGAIRRLPYPFGSSGNTKVTEQDPTTRVSLDRPAQELGYKLGDMMKVTVVIERKDNVLWLPPQAIRTFEGRKFVVVQTDTVQQRVDVKVGIIGGDRVEIVDGLQEGQIVVSP